MFPVPDKHDERKAAPEPEPQPRRSRHESGAEEQGSGGAEELKERSKVHAFERPQVHRFAVRKFTSNEKKGER